MPMTLEEARSLLSRGAGTTDLDGFMKIVEAHLVVWGVPDHEIPARLKRIRDDLTGAGDS
jgi:hypothetical protein